MHFAAVSSRCRVVRVDSLPGGAVARYDLDKGVVEVLRSVTPQECPRVSAAAIARAEIRHTLPELAPEHQERLALRVGGWMARFAEDMELAGGRLAFFRADMEAPERTHWRGLTNGSQPAGRPCANPDCDYRCSPGDVQAGGAENTDHGPGCPVVTCCEWCGLWVYYETPNAAGKPSGEMLAAIEPRGLTKDERLAYVKTCSVVGTIYVE